MISIHAPHAGSDPIRILGSWAKPDFYPRSPCGERRCNQTGILSGRKFLSTLPMRGATSWGNRLCGIPRKFLSTLPMRGATVDAYEQRDGKKISIHAPHAGSDKHDRVLVYRTKHFYPRSPCGERRGSGCPYAGGIIFLSTLPMRGATLNALTTKSAGKHFYPRSPCGERQRNYINMLKGILTE